MVPSSAYSDSSVKGVLVFISDCLCPRWSRLDFSGTSLPLCTGRSYESLVLSHDPLCSYLFLQFRYLRLWVGSRGGGPYYLRRTADCFVVGSFFFLLLEVGVGRSRSSLPPGHPSSSRDPHLWCSSWIGAPTLSGVVCRYRRATGAWAVLAFWGLSCEESKSMFVILVINN